MATLEITAKEFLHGSHRQNLVLLRKSAQRRSRVLWGSFRRPNSSLRLSAKGFSTRSSKLEKTRALVSENVTRADIEPSKIAKDVVHFFRIQLIQESATAELLKTVQTKVSNQIIGLKTEQCFNIGLNSPLSTEKLMVLKWLLGETYEPDYLGTQSFLRNEKKLGSKSVIIEVGPRLSFTTAWSSNAVSICQACGLSEVTRIERSRRYLLYAKDGNRISENQINEFATLVHDRMTECVYTDRLTSFETNVVPEEVQYVPVMQKGRKALEEINAKMGLAFDEQDLEYYTKLFRDDIKRDPTTVELFDVAQSNSEHSRHWFFTGNIVIDGEKMKNTLMQIVKNTLEANPSNSVIGFKDNSSAIMGFPVKQLRPIKPGSSGPLDFIARDLDILLTAETHNFPCAVAPYPGAETGVGGRIRDTHATGRGSFVVASTAGYCVGNLNMEGDYAPWEDLSFTYPLNLASPLQILIDASNGASDYGNKFGEPLIQGYMRTYGSRLPNGERREWLKPIMFSAGIGMIDHAHITKGEPDIGMLVVKIGGPAYRIGMGGGAASSMVSGQNDVELDFNAVQRGDAEMAQKLYRVVRACVEMGESNPIISIHDQGAGGNCNVIKEIIYPKGAKIDIRAIVLGDQTMSVLEIWGAEYQEQDAILVKPESRKTLQSLCEREKVSMAVIGTINGEGREDLSFTYPLNLASPLQILIDASNGASDYGNKFGEPLIQGYMRTYGSRLPNGERREWLKPIMFSAGIGMIDHAHITKGEPDIGMLVVKIGGPAYRIGMGGGAASSMVSGQNDVELDFNAVQRGDAEMAQKLYRVVRACVEMGESNPIISIHDQGAGGNCNVIKEIIYPKGAKIDIRAIVLGDQTMSVLEIWGAEYQEQDAILVKPESRKTLQSLCEREKVSMAVIGTINGEGRVVLVDTEAIKMSEKNGVPPPPLAVDLELEKVLGDLPKKTFKFNRVECKTEPLDIAPGMTLVDALKRVLRLPSVGSKRFLTTKVDRCVTGLVAQQQTVGPLQIPLADVAVIAQTYTGLTGAACSIGEQPIKGLLNPKAMARLTVGEALTNLVFAKVTSLSHVKSSGNWMYAAKLEGEGPAMYDAALALSEAMIELGIAIDGGKDSLSMAAMSSGEVVKAPGNLVISAYVTCPDITKTVTPDLKLKDNGVLVLVDLGKGKRRLGGSALAQVFDQIGDECPDLDDVAYLKKVFNSVQDLIGDELISAGHDVSDGGIIVNILEMAFAGNCGVGVNLTSDNNTLFETLFAEELGLVLEINKTNLDTVLKKFSSDGVVAEVIGKVTSEPVIDLKVDGISQLNEKTYILRDIWEETSFELEMKQRLPACVELEKEGLKTRHEPSWELSFTPAFTDKKYMDLVNKPKVAIIREEGSNGDREMSAAFHASGFEPWDVAMSDLLRRTVSLSDFRGVVFVGGFSYADVLDSAKGWAASIRFNGPVLEQFREFYDRPDTFSLGVCNGCQLMALLGWVPGPLGGGEDTSQPRFVHNESGRFECRFTSVMIKDSPAVMFRGMEGSTLGVWAAHGEGRTFFPDNTIFDKVIDTGLAPVRYCDDDGAVSEVYPFNLNGSPLGVAAICSPDGRHLAMMPHPERCFLMWQYPWYPKHWNVDKKGPSPWLKMFQNAREWCS